MRLLDERKYNRNLVDVPKMAANMYRVGDYVFFETSSTAPYQIRRIEELNKNPTGNVEAKVMCFYRRRDISSSLVMLADKHQSALEEESDEFAKEEELLSGKQRHQLKHRELFLSRQVETLPATHIRGKCTVTLLNETESLLAYLNKEDSFFYSLVYDPQQKTLLADKGEIRVGNKYQVENIPDVLASPEEDTRKEEDLERLSWTTFHPLTDRQIDQFLVISRSIGTFARALDCSSSVKQPSLHMSAAAASRDITLFHAMDILHNSNYDLSQSMAELVPSSGPMLCRDQMEEWSASEANLFEEALEKYGKDFNDIKQDFLPWKSLTSIIEYYYMWKTTDRYVQQKRVKAVEQESKLKQVYIPNYNKPNPAQLTSKGMVNGTENGTTTDGLIESGKACESCGSLNSPTWYSWGPAALACRLCQQCWNYWKKYAGLKAPSKFLPEELEGGYSEPGALTGADAEGQYTCRECNRVFQRHERLLQHMVNHRGHPYRCHVNSCGKEFKLKTHLVRHCATIHGVMVRGGSPRPVMKTRTAFYLKTTPLTRLARRLMTELLHPRHAARQPFWPINSLLIKQECHAKLSGLSPLQISMLVTSVKRKRKKRWVYDILTKLGGGKVLPTPQFLLPTDRSRLPPDPVNPAFPRPPKRKDGSLIYDPVPCKEVSSSPLPPMSGPTINNLSPSLLKRKSYEEHNGLDGQHPKRPMMRPSLGKPTGADMFSGVLLHQPGPLPPPPTIPRLHHVNGRSKLGGRKHVISWVDAPDDVYFHAKPPNKRFRRQILVGELRRAARRPWRQFDVRDSRAVPD